jgi:hypothetical protein
MARMMAKMILYIRVVWFLYLNLKIELTIIISERIEAK